MTQPVRRNTVAAFNAVGGSFNEPMVVTKQSNVEVGDLMVITIGTTNVDPAVLEVAALNPFSEATEAGINMFAPAGWTFEGASAAFVNYSGSSFSQQNNSPESMVAVWTKRVTHADLTQSTYTFTRALWEWPANPGDASHPAGKYTPNSAGYATMLVYRYGQFAGLAKDSIGYSFTPGTTQVDPSSRGYAASGVPTTWTHLPGPISTVAATDQALGVTIAYTPVASRSHDTNGTLVLGATSRPHVAEMGLLEGPTASGPTLYSTHDGTFNTSYYAAAVGFILEPVNTMMIAQVPLPTASYTANQAPTAIFDSTVPFPTASAAATKVDPIPVANVNDYIVSWDPQVFYKLNQAYATSVAFTDSSGDGRTSQSTSWNTTTLQVAETLLAETYAQPAMRFAPTSPRRIDNSTLFPESILAGFRQLSTVVRIRPEQDGPIIVREWFSSTTVQWGLYIIGGKLTGRVRVSGVDHIVTDPNALTFGSMYTVGMKWDGAVLSLFRDAVKVATVTGSTTGSLEAVNFAELRLASGYYTNAYQKAAMANLAIFDYPLPDSAFVNIHNLSITDQAMVTDPPKWGEGQALAAPVIDDYGLAVLADSPAYYFRLDEQDGDAYLRDSSTNGRDIIFTPRVSETWGPPPLEGPSLLPSAPGGGSIHIAGGVGAYRTLDLRTASTAPAVSATWSLEFLLHRLTYMKSTVLVMNLLFNADFTKKLGLSFKGGVNLEADPGDITALGYTQGDGAHAPGWETRYHYVLTCDGVNLKLYADGTVVAEADVSATTGGAGYFSTPPYLLEINSLFEGYLDEIAIYPTVLSAGRVAAHWTATGLEHPGIATIPPPPPPPAERGIILDERFDDGILGAPLTGSDLTLDPSAVSAYADGLDSVGLTFTNLSTTSPGAMWVDDHTNTPKLFHRVMFKFQDDGSGPPLSGTIMQITEYLTEDYAPSFPYGYPLGSVSLIGSGGAVGPASTPEIAIPLEVGVASDQLSITYTAGNVNSLWYRYRPSVDGTVTINTESSATATDPILAIYSGPAPDLVNDSNLSYLTQDDDSGAGFHSRIVRTVTAGVDYYFELTAPYNGGDGMASVQIVAGSPAASNPATGGSAPSSPVTYTLRVGSATNAGNVDETLATLNPDAWYSMEASYIQDVEKIVFRISDVDGTLIAESLLNHIAYPLSALGATGKGAPYGFTVGVVNTGNASVSYDNIAVSDVDWVGPPTPAIPPVIVEGLQALEVDEILTGVVSNDRVTRFGGQALGVEEALAGSPIQNVILAGTIAEEFSQAQTGSANGQLYSAGGLAEEFSALAPVGVTAHLGELLIEETALAGMYPQNPALEKIIVPPTVLGVLGIARTATIQGSGSLTISSETMSVVTDMRLIVVDKILHRAPTVVTVQLYGGVPRMPVRFYIDGTFVYEALADTEGNIDITTITVDEVGGEVGEHAIEARQIVSTGVLLGSDTYTLERDRSITPAVMNSDAQAIEIPEALTATGVRHWVFQDLTAGGLGSYVFPHSPEDMSAPTFEKATSTRHTTALDGQFHLFEAGQIPKEWTFNGYCPTEEQRLRMLEYRHLNRRIYIIDHRNRAWKVVITSAEFTPRLRHVYNDVVTDGHDYEITATILDQKWVDPA